MEVKIKAIHFDATTKLEEFKDSTYEGILTLTIFHHTTSCLGRCKRKDQSLLGGRNDLS